MVGLRGLTRRSHRGAAIVLSLAATVSVLVGCGVIQSVGNGPPVPAGPLGPIVPGEGGQPPIECRGVPLESCRSMGMFDEANVVRVIVTCTGVCTPVRGDVRIDVVMRDGSTQSRGQGSYETAVAAPQPEPAITPAP